MNLIRQCLVLLVLTSNLACSQNDSLNELDFLIGTWKMEGKENYESWKKLDNKFEGESYKIENGLKKVTETIEIKLEKLRIIYTPTVFDQNEGKGIPFQLKVLEDNLYSFENLEHDFPKKIQYKILDNKKLFVSVLGKNEEGFSYNLIKQTYNK